MRHITKHPSRPGVSRVALQRLVTGRLPMADQLATVSKLRLFKRAGVLSEENMLRIDEAIKIQLDIY